MVRQRLPQAAATEEGAQATRLQPGMPPHLTRLRPGAPPHLTQFSSKIFI